MKKPLRRSDNKQRQFHKSLYLNHSSNSSYALNKNSLFEKIQNSLPDYSNEDKSSEKLYSDNKELNLLKCNLECILREMKVVTMKLIENEDEEDKSLEWKFAAMVVDRLCKYSVLFLRFNSFEI
jgi:hypothetical protein